MFVDPGTVLSTGATIYENRHKIIRLAKKLSYLLTRGTLRIAVFGPGGVGKSTLGKFITDDDDNKTSLFKYTESLDTETYSIPGDIVGKLIVPPGQERRIDIHWPELYRDLVQGRSRGIINVVSWGYHSFETVGFEETKYYQPGMTKEQFVNVYLQARRDTEIKVIDELAPRLMDAKHKIWMITLVTKQDLWWKQRADVEKHYREGEYEKYIHSITQKRGERFFAHEYLSASLVMSNLVSGTGDLLAPTTEGYDQNIQLAHQLKLIEMIRSFARR